jgi:protein-L-isoaspartate(D-aspartate) O-methyltransferase
VDTTCLKKPDGMQLIRHNMINCLFKRGIPSGAVLDVMSFVPRHLFVSDAFRYRAYDDISLPIGFGQTISKPSIIARMVHALALTGVERVLEIGTGSGYQTAILSAVAGSVVSIERIENLYERARAILTEMGFCSNVTFFHSGDFKRIEGMFDAIIVAAGADILPVELLSKLGPGGRLVIPVSDGDGHMIKRFIKRQDSSVMEEEIGEAVFVPLIMG